MYSKAILEVLGVKQGSHVHILNSFLSTNKAGYDCFIEALHEDRIEVLSSENRENFNVARKYWKTLSFGSTFNIREADEALTARRQKLALPTVLSPDEDILFGKEATVRLVCTYTIDEGAPRFLWGTESDIDQVLACTEVDVKSRHKLMLKSSPNKEQVRALLQQRRLITDRDFLYGILEFADDFYQGMKSPTTLSHTVARNYLSKLPKAFVAWEISQSVTDNSDVQAAPVQWQFEHELAPNELNQETGEALFGLNDEDFGPSHEVHAKYDLLDTLVRQERYWKASTTEARLSVIMVARRSSLQEQGLIDQINQALPFPEVPYYFEIPGLDGLIEAAIEEGSRPDQSAAPQEPGSSPPDESGDSAASLINYTLPEMTGFAPALLGEDPCLWTSPCYVLADRDLQPDEQIHVWAVDPIDGRVLKTVSLKATEANKARVAWPAALVKAIQADRTLVEGSVLLQAGHLSDDAEFTENTDAPTSQAFTGYNNIEKSQVDRLWAFDSHCKLLSNLPFKANQVSALRLPDAAPPLGERICIQVRHRTSQHLYESHFYQPEANSTRSSWNKQMCEFLNQHSAMLRAGILQDDGISITPAEQGNQLWIPQLSDLSVQLESVNWLEHASFSVNSGLALENEVMIAVHDHVTGAPLPGSPFTFCPSVATQALDQWPSALASQLAASPLAPYIKLEQTSSGGTAPASTWRCLRAAVPLRVWMSEPLASPAWSSRSGADIDDVLDACLDDDSIQLLIESRDTRTGHLCHASSITLSAMESSLDQAAKRANLAKTLEGHLKQNGVVWLGLSIEPNVSGTSLNHWKLREATTLHLQTTLEKIIPAPMAADNHGTPFYIEELATAGPIQKYNDHISIFANVGADMQFYEDYIDPVYYLYLDIYQKGLDFWPGLAREIMEKPIKINISIPRMPTRHDMDELVKSHCEAPYLHNSVMPTIDPIPQNTPDAFSYIISGYWHLLTFPGSPFLQRLAQAFLSRKLIKNTLSDIATIQRHLATIEILTSSPREQLCIALDTQAIEKGFSLASCSQHDGELTLDLNFPFAPDEESATARILIGILSPTSLWKKIQSCTTTKEVFEMPAQDTLCADMANTAGVELFASSGSQPHGVSPQTGLFHFHHTIATLSSLSGNTPAIPLAFNYSPLRANESALGDGFALSGFSSYDNRNRRLVLSNGTVDELSIDNIKQLIDGEPIVRLGYTLKAGQGTTEELSAGGGKRNVYHLSTLTIELLNGHEEVLGLPQTHDNLESGEAYKNRLKSTINRIVKQIDKALEELKTPSKNAVPIWSILGGLLAGGVGVTAGSGIDEHEKTRSIHLSSVVATFMNATWGADLLGKDLEKKQQVTANRTELNKLKTEMALLLADVERNASILVPLQLKADSRALQLAWQGVKGHVRLTSINDGVNVLLKAEHSAEPMLEGSQQSVFTLWPETDERCCITLDIKDCLLRRLTRSSGSQPDQPDQRLHFQYAVTPVLDNILCGVIEDDGSREVVAYDWPHPFSLPRVDLQTLIPGGQQPNTHHAWAWEGEERITAATRYAHAPVGSDLEQIPSTRWEWSHSGDGATELARVIEKVPGEQQRITRHVYQTDNAVPEPLRQPRQTEQHITVEDLRVAATAEEQQP
ncbi:MULTISPECIES: hypothetical protein [Pseudomonas]|uniref:Toxin n=1 Tax=Pseudomonas putida S13.1.2 TaxID=1384061 RepID=A0AAU8S9K3_PSEPU|nr:MULTISPECIES: hypothetical protein [Pseudomonas]AJQ46454.1 hypothetical protein N805_04140 [Pseudomonas putida S13.1.2]